MESSSTPLADYFWIAGLESVSYDDDDGTPQGALSKLDSTIVEDGEPEEEAPQVKVSHSRQNSGNRFSHRGSLQSLDNLDDPTASNRSSATIKPSASSNPNGVSPEPGLVVSGAIPSGGSFLGDFDFDKALLKFAAEREDFLDDLSFTAGAKVQSRPPMVNPRAERIRAEENGESGRMSPLKSIRGSIRRKISFKDMNSMRRQPSTVRPATRRSCEFKFMVQCLSAHLYANVTSLYPDDETT